MASLYTNASPNIIMLGADDQSKRAVSLGESTNPQHLGKFFIYAKKGPKQDMIVSIAELKRLYGDETIDALSKYFNHQTFFARGAASTGNELMVKRVIPDDAGVRSNVAVYMDVVDTEVNNYLRDKNGNILTDEKGNKKVNPEKPKVKGWKIKFITESNKEDEPTQEGLLEPKEGTMLKRNVTYQESETETEVILVDSETEFEEKTVIVPGEFEMVEEDHPTKTEIKLVESETEFDIKVEESTTEFETIMVGTGVFEDVQVRDESLDSYVDKELTLVDMVDADVEKLSVKSVQAMVDQQLLSKHREALAKAGVCAGVSTAGVFATVNNIGCIRDNSSVAVLYKFKDLQARHPKKFRPAEILADFQDPDMIFGYFKNNIVRKYGQTTLVPNLRITNKETGEIKYAHTSTLLNNTHYEFKIVGNYFPAWVANPDGFIISPNTDFNNASCPYMVEYIAIDELRYDHRVAANTQGPVNAGWPYTSNFCLYTGTWKFYADPKYVYMQGGELEEEIKCLEDFEKLPNPFNSFNVRLKYTQFGITQYLFLNSKEPNKFYTLDLDPLENFYKFSYFGTVEDLDITIPLKEDLEDYETAPNLFNKKKEGTQTLEDGAIQAVYVREYETQPSVIKGTGADAGKLFLSEPSGTRTAVGVSLDLNQANWNPSSWVGLNAILTIKTADGKENLPVEFIKDIINQASKYKPTKMTAKVLIPGYKTESVEVEEPKQVPKKIETKIPKMVEKEVPVKVMVQKPKTMVTMVPKKVEKVVPKKIEIVTYTPSTMYPILEVRAKYQGEHYNNIGFSINTSYGDKFDSLLAKKVGWYPLGLQLWERKSAKHMPLVKKTMGNELDAEMIFTEDQLKNPMTETRVDLGYVFNNNWYNETSRLLPYEPFEYEYFKVYDNNVKTLLKGFMETEKECISFIPEIFTNGIGTNSEWYDFVGSTTEEIEDQFGLINPFTCRTSKNVRLQTIQISEDRPKLKEGQKEVNIGANKPIFLEGGSDGTLSDENYEELVQRELNEYIDPNSEMQDLPYSKESTIYDSGFDLDTKKKFTNFISLRKDTYVVMTTHMAKLGTKFFNVSQSRSIAAVLNTELKLAPESTYYGTPACRGIIVMGAGLLEDGTSDLRIPASYEVMIKICKLAGAGNGKWDMNNLFDGAPNNTLKLLKDYEPRFIPGGIKPLLWESSCIWAQRCDRNEYHFPAFQTIYDDDTSIANSLYVIMALSAINKVADRVNRRFLGKASLPDAIFKAEVEKEMNAELEGMFGTVFNPIAECIITDLDKKKGFVWRTNVTLRGANMKTVCLHSITLRRMDDEE